MIDGASTYSGETIEIHTVDYGIKIVEAET